jgi:steroid 5-alpha reductase family enzyme
MNLLHFGFPFDAAALAVTLAITLMVFALLWLVSLKVDDAGIVDYYWGLGFPVIGWTTYAMTGGGTAALILLAGTTVWALRLAAHMILRHQKTRVEDPRYAKMRAEGGPNFKMRSLATIFLLQGLLLWLIASPLHATGLMIETNALFWFGLIIFVVGLVYETVADWQLMQFRNNPRNSGRLMQDGLFRYSRHPNYFGEIVLWWGLAIAAFAASGSPYLFVGPALLTLILLRISGPPMMAAHLAGRPGYEEWLRRTPALIPRFGRMRVPVQTPAE